MKKIHYFTEFVALKNYAVFLHFLLIFYITVLLCWCGLFRLMLCQLIDARSVIESKPELYAAWKNMAQVLMSTAERR